VGEVNDIPLASKKMDSNKASMVIPDSHGNTATEQKSSIKELPKKPV
jgi:hypothetical protein